MSSSLFKIQIIVKLRQGPAKDGPQGERPQSLKPCQELTLKLVVTHYTLYLDHVFFPFFQVPMAYQDQGCVIIIELSDQAGAVTDNHYLLSSPYPGPVIPTPRWRSGHLVSARIILNPTNCHLIRRWKMVTPPVSDLELQPIHQFSQSRRKHFHI